MTVEEEPYCNMKTYVHMGMFATAVTIQNMLFENEVLQRAFEKHPVSFIRFCWNLKLNSGAYLCCHIIFTLHICSLPCSAEAMLLGWVFSLVAAYLRMYVLGQVSLCLKRSLSHFMAFVNPLSQDYQLVVVGHSLGAGAAGVLSVLLREDYPGLVCYTYSPVGCVFNLPLVQYTKKFITSFVIGNDVIPRYTYIGHTLCACLVLSSGLYTTIHRFTTRSLIHLTNAMNTQLKNCQQPKVQRSSINKFNVLV